MKYTSLLERLGIEKRSAEIYLFLLDAGPSSVAKIAQSLDYHRAEVYHALPLLLEDNMVVKISKWKRLLYRSESPDTLRQKFELFESQYKTALPKLMDSYRERAERPVFTYNEGREELAHLNLRVLEVVPEGGIYFRLSSGRHAPNSHLYISPEYENLRDIKELERMVITSEKNRTQKPSSPGRHVQTIPASFDPFDDHITKIIYADRVSIIDYESETAFTVQSERYARYEEKLFRLLSRLLAESK